MFIGIEEINNTQLKSLLETQHTSVDLPFEITEIFQHRYTGGQCDYGYKTADGETFAYYGSHIECELDESSTIFDSHNYSDIIFE